MDTLNAIAGSAFVALLLSMVANVFLYRMLLASQDRNDIERARSEKSMNVVGEMASALKESNNLLRGALDTLTRRRG